ncbi:restriction endonuclease subunit S [Staphylococcus epidermidis]
MTEHTNTPELRFPEFNEEWREFNLKDISTKKNKKNKNKLYNETFTNSAEYGIVSQKDYFDKEISNVRNLSNYYIVDPDDFVYNPRISRLAPVGPINRNKLNRIGVMSPLYTVFSTKLSIKSFLEYYFKTTKWHKFMKLNGDSGARSDRFTIKQSLFVKMPIVLPSEQEQEKIGKFFSKLDQQIELEEKKLELLEQQKKGYMQKIFSQELRFKDENGNKYPKWTNTLIKDLFINKGGTALEKEFENNGDYKVISIGSYSMNSTYNDQNLRINKNEKTEKYILSQGDLAMVLNDKTKDGNIIGRSIFIDKDNHYIYNQRTERLIPLSENDNKFLWFLMNTDIVRNKIKSMMQGATQVYINYSSIKNISLQIPSFEEQIKIREFLEILLHSITKQDNKVKLLKQRKQGLLQKMFV